MIPDGLPTKVVLHLGAHKTASTHLQHAIIAAKPFDDVAFWGPRLLRGRGESIPERFGFPLDVQSGVASPLTPAQMLAEMADGAPRLVLSEETFAGRLQGDWGRIPVPLYDAAPARVAKLAEKIAEAGGPPVDICLGIRNPADYIGSAFSQFLMGKRTILPEKYRAKNAITSIDWADYVHRLREVPGVGQLTVWAYEHYAALFPDICRALIGRDDPPFPETRVQPRLSVKAVDAVLVAKSWADADLTGEAADLLPIGPDNPPFDLFSETDHARSTAFYDMQLAKIAAMPDVNFLQK